MAKAIDEYSPHKRLLLAKIIIYCIKNNGLDDFHEILFNNLNIFTKADFNNIILINSSILSGEISTHSHFGCYVYNIVNKDFSLLSTILKLISIQIFQEEIITNTFAAKHSNDHRTSVMFYIHNYENFIILINYIKSFNV